MKLYKYKSLSGDSFVHVLDILIHNYLYLAEWKKLNDPLEGFFNIGIPSQNGMARNLITDAKSDFRVCSLSQNGLHPLLWSHYADSHSGVAIELEVEETCQNIHHVNYDNELPILDGNDRQNIIKALTSKGLDWKYESEVRIVDNQKWFKEFRVTGIMLGLRINTSKRLHLSKICNEKTIPIIRYFEGRNYNFYQIPSDET